MADRNPTKQRRAAQNKSARQALATRTVKANEPRRAVVEADEPASTRGARGGGRGAATTARGSSRLAGRGAPVKGNQGRPARTAAAVPARQPTNPISKAIADVQSVPGGKGVFFGLLFSIVAAVMILGFRVTPQPILVGVGKSIGNYRHDHGIKIPTGVYRPKVGTVKENIPKAQFVNDYALAVLGPIAVPLALAPLLITGTAFALAGRENRRRNFTIAAFAMFFVVIVAGALAIFYFFSLGGLGYAAFKARQADPPPLRGRRARDQAGDGDEDDLDDEG